MASNDTGARKRNATEPPPGSESADNGRKRPRSDSTSEPVWPSEWIIHLLNFPSSGATIEQCARLATMIKRAVSAVPDILASWDPPLRRDVDQIDEYLTALEQTLTERVSVAPETADPNDPYGTYANERDSWPSSWSAVWQLLVDEPASSENHARYRSIVTAANDYCNEVLDIWEPPSLEDGQTIEAFLDHVDSTLDLAIIQVIDEDDDLHVVYAKARRSWPQPWKEARESLTKNRASTAQRGRFRDILLAATTDLPTALTLMDPPTLALTAGLDGFLAEIEIRLRAQTILCERRATPVERIRLVENLQRVISISPEIMNSWKAKAPAPEDNEIIGAFLERVRSSLQTHKLSSVIALWEDDIYNAAKAGARTRDLLAMRTRLNAMESYVTDGGELYRPADELPADANLVPGLPEFEDLTQTYGFESPGNNGLPGFWRWEASVGEGANGYAGVWLQFGISGHVKHRVVIKDNYIPGPQWDWSQTWDDRAAGLPSEVAINQRLNSCKDSSNIVLCHGHRIHAAERMFRIYLEYCELTFDRPQLGVEAYCSHSGPHGDLEKLIEEHVRVKNESVRDSQGNRFSL